jgi:hypothetical protein
MQVPPHEASPTSQLATHWPSTQEPLEQNTPAQGSVGVIWLPREQARVAIDAAMNHGYERMRDLDRGVVFGRSRVGYILND